MWDIPNGWYTERCWVPIQGNLGTGKSCEMVFKGIPKNKKVLWTSILGCSYKCSL